MSVEFLIFQIWIVKCRVGQCRQHVRAPHHVLFFRKLRGEGGTSLLRECLEETTIGPYVRWHLKIRQIFCYTRRRRRKTNFVIKPKGQNDTTQVERGELIKAAKNAVIILSWLAKGRAEGPNGGVGSLTTLLRGQRVVGSNQRRCWRGFFDCRC